MLAAVNELSFCPVLAELYSTRRTIGRSGNPVSLTGGLSTTNNLLAIRRLMMASNASTTLEVGLACGGSALAFASSHRDLGHAATHQHVAIDPFQEDFDDVGVLNLERAGLQDYVEVRHKLSSFALAELLEGKARFDMVYIDGSHNYDDVFVDFYYIRRMMTPGAYVLFDDSSDKDVLRVIRYAESDLKGELMRVPASEYRLFRSKRDFFAYTIAQVFSLSQLTVFRKSA